VSSAARRLEREAELRLEASGGCAYGVPVASGPPTKKQLALLRKLAAERTQTFAIPRTMREASDEISRLMALHTNDPLDRGRRSRAGTSRTRAKNVG
jgi:hypothetical protein